MVPDAKWPNMYRLRFPDGRLTDMVNLTRAKDALAAMKGGGHMSTASIKPKSGTSKKRVSL
jgi:hypothetical protein